ncbi:hypothetical protein OG342_03195 [Streptomyces bobili]|uniref:hypothetical protein n=1 Tax=Streptomyces bobili TaxID=67280 RepID=UPI0022528262|nr:hypothetical protein [Streptomyces bobili]MCX5521877.1 hypothetical protein [Streptomyces bobili]
MARSSCGIARTVGARLGKDAGRETDGAVAPSLSLSAPMTTMAMTMTMPGR